MEVVVVVFCALESRGAEYPSESSISMASIPSVISCALVLLVVSLRARFDDGLLIQSTVLVALDVNPSLSLSGIVPPKAGGRSGIR